MSAIAVVFAALVLAFSVAAGWLSRVYVTAPIVFVVAGAVISISLGRPRAPTPATSASNLSDGVLGRSRPIRRPSATGMVDGSMTGG